MPVDFLTPEQRSRYGRFTGCPSPEQLARYFYLDDADRARLARKRGGHNRLGFAVQLGTVRFLGTFLPDPTEVPGDVTSYLAGQLGVRDRDCLERYRTSETRWDHAQEIRTAYGYRDFGSQPETFRLVRWLYTRAWLSSERPSLLFDLATARLAQQKILLPGVSTLERLIARVRDRASERLWRALATVPTPDQRLKLEELLKVPEDGRQSRLERLQRAPTRVSAPSLLDALERWESIRALGIGEAKLSRIPPNKIQTLARYAAKT